MRKSEYLDWLLERLNNNEITKEAYEHGVEHADLFSEAEEE